MHEIKTWASILPEVKEKVETEEEEKKVETKEPEPAFFRRNEQTESYLTNVSNKIYNIEKTIALCEWDRRNRGYKDRKYTDKYKLELEEQLEKHKMTLFFATSYE
jgi:hypothetical protein